MPVYNGEKYLKEAIVSVLNQTEKDFEFVIVDDGSTDHSLQIIRGFADDRIRLIQKPHSGLIDTLNAGLKECRGEYIARMDADDVSLPERLEKQVQFLDRNQKVVMCGTWAQVIDGKGEIIGEYVYPPLGSGAIRRYIWCHNPFIHPTVMVKKDIWDVVGGYHSFWKNTGDDELWTRLVFRYETANLGEKLLNYRQHGAQLTTKKKFDMRWRGLLLRLLALKRFFKV